MNTDTETHFVIVGYFGHANVGDEQYKISFQEVFKQFIPTSVAYRLSFIDCDLLSDFVTSDNDVIVLGGGDVLNDYFLDRLIAKFKGHSNRIIGVSVGLPYVKTLTDSNKLNVIDYVFIRAQHDLELFRKHFHPDRIAFIPDISYVLMQSCGYVVPKTSNKYVHRLALAKQVGKKIVCMSLARNIYDDKSEQHYQGIITNLGHFVKFLIQFGYHVIFVPFNTNHANPLENDIVIHQDVVNFVKQTTNTLMSHITVVDEQLSAAVIFDILEHVDLSVPMRYHACLFAVYRHVPFLPIFTTRKLKNLLLDIGWTYGYELPTNPNGIPTQLDLNTLMSRFVGLCESLKKRNYLHDKLTDINIKAFTKPFYENIPKLVDILTSRYSKSDVQAKKSDYVTDFDDKIRATHAAVTDFAVSKGYASFQDIDKSNLQDIVVNIVSFKLTGGNIHSSFNDGLKQKMFATKPYDYDKEWRWIINKINSTQQKREHVLFNNPRGIVDIGFMDQIDYSGSHRSGWQFVYDNIKFLHNTESNLLLDLYVDRTFHWNIDVNKAIGLVPYKKAWVGFIHHTFDTSFSDHNCKQLLATPEFIESLSVCKGLFVLSKALKASLDTQFKSLGCKTPVYSFVHPTQMHVPEFTMTQFLNNTDKKLIQVGGWLRNTYAFYTLCLPKLVSVNYGFLLGDSVKVPQTCQKVKIRKVALLGKNMSNYHPDNNFHGKLRQGLVQNTPVTAVDNSTMSNASSNVKTQVENDGKIWNNWDRSFYADVVSKTNSVEYLNHLDNAKYDKLLAENVVFINLVDASAINTLIECIVRNTPIIVNKLPAVVELLGDKYPLYVGCQQSYYELNKEVEGLLNDPNAIRKAHNYMKRLDKTMLSKEEFLKQFMNIIGEIRLK
jgi:hypothetical protein